MRVGGCPNRIDAGLADEPALRQWHELADRLWYVAHNAGSVGSEGVGWRRRIARAFFRRAFAFNDIVADIDALVANVDVGGAPPGDEPSHLVLVFAAERAHDHSARRCLWHPHP